ncbi:MAG: hypothetical protein ABI778_01545 [Ignavibacteriota bacterium]
MNNIHTKLEDKYKDMPGKIIRRQNDFLIAASNENKMDPNDLQILKRHEQKTEFTPESRLRWLKVATFDPDRAGDEMVIGGAMTDNFLRNPQFLWMHGQTSEPVHTIGKIVRLIKTETALYALAQYTEPLFSKLAENIYQLDVAGYLPANSIGFRPIEWEENKYGGYRFLKWELIEISKVELPCNPFAVDDGAPASKRLTISEAADLL